MSMRTLLMSEIDSDETFSLPAEFVLDAESDVVIL